MDRKFRVLRLIGSIYKILGIISAVLTLILALGICLVSLLGGAMMDQVQRELGRTMGPLGMVGGAAGGAIVAAFVVIYGAVMTLFLYGAGEGIYLLLALEENTRSTAICLQQYSAPDAGVEG
jgi:hypothetical protein